MNNTTWFKKVSWAYLPTTFMGIAVTIIAIVFLIPVYGAIIEHERSLTNGLYDMFVYTTCTAFWWKWVAEKTS